VKSSDWKQLSGKAQEKWGKLTEDHLRVVVSKRDQLTGKIQELYDIGKDEANKQIDQFAASVHDLVNEEPKKH
jgi:uncharacterized protein YjbJ (UPF0337 family)